MGKETSKFGMLLMLWLLSWCFLLCSAEPAYINGIVQPISEIDLAAPALYGPTVLALNKVRQVHTFSLALYAISYESMCNVREAKWASLGMVVEQGMVCVLCTRFAACSSTLGGDPAVLLLWWNTLRNCCVMAEVGCALI